MAVTRADVTLTADTWTDLYAATGIAVGTAVNVTNKGSRKVFLAIKLAAPTGATFGYPLFAGDIGNFAAVDAAEVGLWAYCADGAGILLVQD